MTTHRSTNRELTGEDADGNTYVVKCEFVEKKVNDPADPKHDHWEISAVNARLEDGRELRQDGDVWKTVNGPELVLHVSGSGSAEDTP
ncbi:hypothetical protein QTH91_00170 [Variovorax dokdonensis]|uniref:Uncharacterized protein n=1 Tax=Variovorax dokdonensis TaxID=344883 RepID=A0ABT7N4L1_9BURK|nr:hypothetical protein [Variovorax dokdonensis]MDM0042882.1 hypothetical protein [Variovorax dokdonensis]